MRKKLSEKELDCIIKEYEILWDYYKKTLDERNNMFKNFSMFIGILSVVLSIAPNLTAMNTILAGSLVIVISLIGISFSLIFISECKTSDKYLKKIREIREVIVLSTNIPPKVYNSDDTLNSRTINIINKMSRCFPLCLLNSLSLFVGIHFVSTYLFYSIILSSALFIAQIVVYTLWQLKE
jgi:hypothetical protein